MPAELAPWLAIAGLGAFHGLNPAMGWLFAVGLGMHRQSGKTVVVSLMPIVLGHAAAIAAVLAAAIALGLVVDGAALAKVVGGVLILWAGWHLAFGHRRRVRVGMQAGLFALGAWSFLMATAHGAGLMLLPVALPLCLSDGPAAGLTAGGSLATGLAAVGVHTAAMLVVIAAIALSVYAATGVGFLRRGWINLDLAWSFALFASGVVLLVA
jgi:hypothetical protein